MPKPITRAYSRYCQDALGLLGQLIRVGRVERKLTAQELATRAGISRTLLQRIEKGDPGCAIGAVFEVAAIVGVPLFEADKADLARHRKHAEEKLALLPKSVRKPAKALKDDF